MRFSGLFDSSIRLLILDLFVGVGLEKAMNLREIAEESIRIGKYFKSYPLACKPWNTKTI